METGSENSSVPEPPVFCSHTTTYASPARNSAMMLAGMDRDGIVSGVHPALMARTPAEPLCAGGAIHFRHKERNKRNKHIPPPVLKSEKKDL